MQLAAAVRLGALLLAACCAEARPVCVGEMCYPSEAAARAAGVDDQTLRAALAAGAHGDAAGRYRLAEGYMDAPRFCAFLRNEPPPRAPFSGRSAWMIVLLVLAGGLAANLTPCVLPLVPVNLVLVGRGWRRGAAYGLGITCAYGLLGLLAAFGGCAFGAWQASPWFNLVAATAFTVLGLAMCEVFYIDFTRWRPRLRRPGAAPAGARAARGPVGGLGRCFVLGAGAAALAGACVEPILLATLVFTAQSCAAGHWGAAALPFVLGAGLGLPWPFAAAGLSVLPKPGAWMRWVNRVFALVLFAAALHYGALAARGFARAPSAPVPAAAADDDARPTLYVVGAPWCRACAAMRRSTLQDAAVRAELARLRVVRVEINDFDELKRHPALADVPIRGVPAYVLRNEKGAEE